MTSLVLVSSTFTPLPPFPVIVVPPVTPCSSRAPLVTLVIETWIPSPALPLMSEKPLIKTEPFVTLVRLMSRPAAPLLFAVLVPWPSSEKTTTPALLKLAERPAPGLPS